MALKRSEGSASCPGHSLPPGKTRYPLYRRLGGPQGRSGQVRKISPPAGIRSPDRPACKVKCTLVQALRLCTGCTAHRGSRGIALLFHDQRILEGGEGSASRPGRSLPPGTTRYPLYRRLGGLQGWSGQMRKISPPTGIRSPDRPVRKVKCTLVQALRLCTGRTTHRGSRGIALLFHDQWH